jgi:predicted enzyme related to lactoylglutathione lyase
MPDRRVVLVGAGAIAAGLGRALPARSAADRSSRKETGMGRVVGLGGVFLKVEDEKAWRDWYTQALGVKFADFGGAVFTHPKKGVTQISPFAASSDYFKPSTAPFMINLIVEDIDGLIAQAAAHGAPCLGRQDDATYGRFAWLLDPAGIKVELWEPA